MILTDCRVAELGATGSSSDVSISDLNRELKQIRITREETGCSCKPLKLDKLSVVKLKAELSSLGARPKDIESMGKTELTSKLKEMLVNCKLCTESGCCCVELGVPCSAESCSCLKGGIRTEQQQPCANPYGQQVFDPDLVREYRAQFVAPPAFSDAVKLREKMTRRGSH